MEVYANPVLRLEPEKWEPAPVIFVTLQPDRRQGPFNRRRGARQGGRRAEDPPQTARTGRWAD